MDCKKPLSETATTVKLAVEEAVRKKADLWEADLWKADLWKMKLDEKTMKQIIVCLEWKIEENKKSRKARK